MDTLLTVGSTFFYYFTLDIVYK